MSDVNKLISVFFVSFFSLILIILYFLPSPTSTYWTREAGPIEDFGAVMFLAGALAAIATASQARGLERVNFAIWAFLSLLFFGEETAYLQHWIGYATPGWLDAMNAQGEVTVHNLNQLQGGSLLDGRISLETLLKSQNLFRIGFTLYFLVLPLAYLFFRPARVLLERLSIPLVGRNLLTSAWLVILLSLILRLAGGEPAPLAETRETVYGTTVGIFLITHWWERYRVWRR